MILIRYEMSRRNHVLWVDYHSSVLFKKWSPVNAVKNSYSAVKHTQGHEEVKHTGRLPQMPSKKLKKRKEENCFPVHSYASGLIICLFWSISKQFVKTKPSTLELVCALSLLIVTHYMCLTEDCIQHNKHTICCPSYFSYCKVWVILDWAESHNLLDKIRKWELAPW